MALTTKQKHRTLVAKRVISTSKLLIEALDEVLPTYSRSRKKQFLQNRCVTLNDTPTTQFDASVKGGDEVKVYNMGFPEEFSSPLASILWMDDDFILLEKKEGIATVSNHPGLRDTLYRQVSNYLKAYNPTEKIFLLNRLDSETGGLILFARNREIQQQVLADWGKYIPEQRFVAVVEGLFVDPTGELKGTMRHKSTDPEGKSKHPLTRRSKTTYKVLKEGEYSTLVELTLHGRFNGIRTLLAEELMPILGENSPTAVFQNQKKLHLQQTSFLFIHPKSRKKKLFKLDIPAFYNLTLKKPMTRSERERAKKQNSPNIKD